MNLFYKVVRKLQYIYNTSFTFDYEEQRGGWKKYSAPVFGSEKTGSVFDPFVIIDKTGYRMYVSERKTDSIISVKSDNGIQWGQSTVALSCMPNSSWERKVNRATVVKYGEQWYMWYTGQNETQSAIGIALSRDAIHFQRVQEQPVLVADQPYEKQSVMNPCVLWDEKDNIFKMWYAAGEKYEPDVLCYAESPDGINWKKYSKNPVLHNSSNKYDRAKVGGCDIKYINKRYIMYYIGYQNVDVARICVAESENGIDGWKRIKDNPIISPSKDKWDASAIYKPTVIYEKGRIRLWYNGRSNNVERIGYAELNSEPLVMA